MEVNGGKAPASLSIEETSLSSNIPLNQILADKWQWKGVDDANAVTSLIESPVDRGGLRGVALEPQRLRAFTVTFNRDPSKLTHTFNRPRPSFDSVNPMKVIRTKGQLRPTDNIRNTHHEITINGQKNDNYDKNVMGRTKPAPNPKELNPVAKPTIVKGISVPTVDPHFSNLRKNSPSVAAVISNNTKNLKLKKLEVKPVVACAQSDKNTTQA